MEGIIQDITVLDLTDRKGQFCGRVLADLGAEVLRIEKPGADEACSLDPVAEREKIPNTEEGAFWLFCNLYLPVNKQT